MNISIPGNFNISSDYECVFPNRSHLYITNETILSESCKDFFGEKSVYVHFEGSFNIADKTTKEVIKYISIPFEIHRSKEDLIYYQTKCLHLISLIPNIKS